MSIYQTRRQQRRSRRKNTVKKVILITVLFALAGTAAFVYIRLKNEKGFLSWTSKAKNKPPEIQEAVLKDTSKAAVNTIEAPIAIAPKIIDTAKKTDSATAAKAGKKISTDTTGLITALKPAKAPVKEPAREVEKKQLSRQQMTDILNEVLLEKSRMNSFSNCIQIRKTATSNVEDVFKIADFLRSKGFVISGRLTIPASQKGVSIDASGSCITLTVGNL